MDITRRRVPHKGLWFGMVLAPLLLACGPLNAGATMAADEAKSEISAPAATAATVTPVAVEADPAAAYANFEAWRTDFASRAKAEGLAPASVDVILADLVVDEKVIRLLNAQAEFIKTLPEYVAGAVNAKRVARGRDAFAARLTLLKSLEAEYGVPAEIVAAIWGMETAFGETLGGMDAPRSLATIAFEGRRRGFAERELKCLMTMHASGAIERAKMVGSWSGAMGHTQFMPCSYVDRAIDWNKDGRRDIWTEPTDALASTAAYLAGHGWQKGAPWGLEVSLPPGFDLTFGAMGEPLPLREFLLKGAKPVRDQPVDAQWLDAPTELFLPGGKNGPAFLIMPNFKVIMSYNKAEAYALGVSLLGEAVAGHAPSRTPFPVMATKYSRAGIMDLQRDLAALGHYTGAIDGLSGPGMRRALARFQKAEGLAADGFLSPALIDLVHAKAKGTNVIAADS